MPNRAALVDAAISYVNRGWHVLRVHDVVSGCCSCGDAECKSAGKHPRGAGWTDGGMTASDQIMRAWSMTPRANIGVLTGKPSGFWVLDVDPKNGGDIALAELVKEHGHLGVTRSVHTGSGGWHFHFAMPDDFEPTNSPGRLPPGLDIRGTGGFVVMPPSVSGVGPYTGSTGNDWMDFPVIAAPGWLLDLVRPPVRVPVQRSAPSPSSAPPSASDGDRYAQYAAKAVVAELARLADEAPGRRGLTAYEVACNLIELINADWSRLDEDDVFARFEEAAGKAMDAGGDFDLKEAGSSWKSAARRIGSRSRERPILDEISGGVVDVPFMPGAGGEPSPTIPVTPTAALSEAFWASRPTLGHIRRAAHARGRSADLVLMGVLARLSAMVSPELKFDAGLGPGSLNLFVIAIGPSGVGKSAGSKIARELIPAPLYLDGDKFRDGIGVGTGEGLAEAYMGTVAEKIPDLNDDGTPKMASDGNAKTKTVRKRTQVRHNVFFYVDEGQALTSMAGRNGATIGPALRSAAVGELLGQANAREETTRHLPAGSYSLGLLIGFQPETVQPLLADAAGGTPQRFLWCSAVDHSVPTARLEYPGPLHVDLTWHPMSVGQTPATGVIDFPDAVKDELWALNLAKVRGQSLNGDELDSHASLLWCKVAALLALLDGRREVTQEDWELAKVVWAASVAVRGACVDFGRAAERAAAERRLSAHEALVTRGRQAEDVYEDKRVVRIARNLARKVHDLGALTRDVARNKITAYRDREHFEAAADHAAIMEWIVVDGDKLTPGSSRPADQ